MKFNPGQKIIHKDHKDKSYMVMCTVEGEGYILDNYPYWGAGPFHLTMGGPVVEPLVKIEEEDEWVCVDRTYEMGFKAGQESMRNRAALNLENSSLQFRDLAAEYVRETEIIEEEWHENDR